eukprot:360202-Chlamydomonas_euryale.AAC.1
MLSPRFPPRPPASSPPNVSYPLLPGIEGMHSATYILVGRQAGKKVGRRVGWVTCYPPPLAHFSLPGVVVERMDDSLRMRSQHTRGARRGEPKIRETEKQRPPHAAVQAAASAAISRRGCSCELRLASLPAALDSGPI